MNDDARESSFMRAAERQVTTLVHAARWHKFWIWMLGIVSLILVASCIGLAIVAYRESQLVSAVQQGAVTACRGGNAQRDADIKIWDTFIQLALKNNHNPQDQTEGKAFESYIAQVNAPHNCQQLFDGSR